MLLQIAAKSEKRMPRESQGCHATQRFRRCGRRRLLGRRAEPRGAPEFGSLRRFTLAPGFALRRAPCMCPTLAQAEAGRACGSAGHKANPQAKPRRSGLTQRYNPLIAKARSPVCPTPGRYKATHTAIRPPGDRMVAKRLMGRQRRSWGLGQSSLPWPFSFTPLFFMRDASSASSYGTPVPRRRQTRERIVPSGDLESY